MWINIFIDIHQRTVCRLTEWCTLCCQRQSGYMSVSLIVKEIGVNTKWSEFDSSLDTQEIEQAELKSDCEIVKNNFLCKAYEQEEKFKSLYIKKNCLVMFHFLFNIAIHDTISFFPSNWASVSGSLYFFIVSVTLRSQNQRMSMGAGSNSKPNLCKFTSVFIDLSQGARSFSQIKVSNTILCQARIFLETFRLKFSRFTCFFFQQN